MEKYPWSTNFPLGENAKIGLYISSEDLENATWISLDLASDATKTMVRGDRIPAEKFTMMVSVKDAVIIEKLLSWSPQKAHPFILDVFHSFAMHHWLNWLSSLFWDWKKIWPELTEEIAAVEAAVDHLRERYYRLGQKAEDAEDKQS